MSTPPTFGVRSTFTCDDGFEAIDALLSQYLGLPLHASRAPYGRAVQWLKSEPSSSSAGHSFDVCLLRFDDLIYPHPEVRLAYSAKETHQDVLRAGEILLHDFFERKTDDIDTLVICAPSEQYVAEDAVVGRLKEHIARLPCRQHVTLVSPSWLLSQWHAYHDAATASWYDAARDLSAHEPYPTPFQGLLATTVARWLASRLAPPRKVLVLDCDNTLWGGVVGEVGPHGVAITAAHQALQQWTADQAQAGVVVCLATKNNEEDVRAVWAARGESMPLSLSRVLSIKAGWGSKSAALRQLSSSLSLPLDAFLFLDDSPMEVEEVRQGCPGVTALRVPLGLDGPGMTAWLAGLWATDTPRTVASWMEEGVGLDGTAPLMPQAGAPLTAEDASRTALYGAALARSSARASSLSLASFLSSLALVIQVEGMDREGLARAAQLTMRTNQMNAHKWPLAEAQLALMAGLDFGDPLALGQAHEPSGPCTIGRASHDLWMITVRDRFGHYGNVGLVGARSAPVPLQVLVGQEHVPSAAPMPVCEVELLMLSCRVLARGVEHEVVRWLARHAEARGASGGVLIRWCPSDRNEPMRRFLWGPGLLGSQASGARYYPDPPPQLSLAACLARDSEYLAQWMRKAGASAPEGSRLRGVVRADGALVPDTIPGWVAHEGVSTDLKPKRPACRFGHKCLRVGIDRPHTLSYGHAFLCDQGMGEVVTATAQLDGQARLDLQGLDRQGGLSPVDREWALSILVRASLERARSAPDRAFLGAATMEDLGTRPVAAHEKPGPGWVHIPLATAHALVLDPDTVDESEAVAEDKDKAPAQDTGSTATEAQAGTSDGHGHGARVALSSSGKLLHAWPSDTGLARLAWTFSGLEWPGQAGPGQGAPHGVGQTEAQVLAAQDGPSDALAGPAQEQANPRGYSCGPWLRLLFPEPPPSSPDLLGSALTLEAHRRRARAMAKPTVASTA